MAGEEPLAPARPEGREDQPSAGPGSRGALAVAAGIFSSRISGLARAAATSAVFGVGPHADVFLTALRAPNVLQNLLGEQALSASFIPTYSRMLARGDEAGARRLAGAIFGLLLMLAGGLALLGVLAARPLVALFAGGYLLDAAQVAAGTLSVDRFELAVEAVRWIFPMTGILVLSAWALGVLNSHRRFFLPYVAPVAWNVSIIAALAWASQTGTAIGSPADAGRRLVIAACVGALIGGALQFAVQLPGVVRAMGPLRPAFSTRTAGVRETIAAFGPAVAGRGVVQLSSYLDQLLASLLAVGAVSALGYAQMIYLLPVSLFGQAVAAAALPDLSRAAPSAGLERLAAGARDALGRTAFFIAPATVGLWLFAPIAVAGLYRLLPGRFGAADVALVGGALAAYVLGLPASTSSRVLQSTFFALGDTRTPARIAALRVSVGTAVALPLMWGLDSLSVERLPWYVADAESGLRLGALGLAFGASVGAWVERWRLGAALGKRLPGWAPSRTDAAWRALLALVSVIPAASVAWWAAGNHPTVRAVSVFGTLIAVYLGGALTLRLRHVDQIAPGRRSRES